MTNGLASLGFLSVDELTIEAPAKQVVATYLCPSASNRTPAYAVMDENDESRLAVRLMQADNRDETGEMLAKLKVVSVLESLPGVGKVTERNLHALGIRKVGDLARLQLRLV